MTHYYAIVDKETGEVSEVFSDENGAKLGLANYVFSEGFEVIPVSIVPVKNKKK